MDPGRTTTDSEGQRVPAVGAAQAFTAQIMALRHRHGLSGEALTELLDLVDAALRTPLVEPGSPPAPPQRPEERYTILDFIDEGGIGEVWRVHDPVLDRPLAMKILRADRASEQGEAFLREARLVASLDHPALVPVYNFGRLPAPDGRPFFTMREVRGRTFSQLIDEVHGRGPSPHSSLLAPLRRLLRAFHTACLAVAHAHERGVLHRDIKPDNVMIGEHGEVFVMDWGLARFTEAPALVGLRGTLIYMAPELTLGAGPAPSSDIYGLGAMLYQVLSGKTPYTGSFAEVLSAVQAGPPPPPSGVFGIPDALEAICARAMARDPAHRYPDAGALAEDVEAWLEGVRRNEEAAELVEQADEADIRAQRLRDRAGRHRRQSGRTLRQVPAHAPEEQKRAGWSLADSADDFDQQAYLRELDAMQMLRAALTRVPDHQPALDRLAQRFYREHVAATEAGDRATAARMEAQLRACDPAGRYAEYLSGRGHLTLHCDQPAEVELFRYVERHRRLVLQLVDRPGPAPVDKLELEGGSYLALLRRTDGQTIPYPVLLRSQDHWDGRAPESLHPLVIPLNQPAPPGTCVVPPGPFSCGGDARAFGAPLPAARVWVEGFAMDRFPITNAQYIAFLDDLVAQGLEELALAHAPRERSAQANDGALIYGRHPDGRFFLTQDADGDLWEPDWPVVMVNWSGAAAYARWRAQRDGLPWRLPYEIEWEKAARGVDGRSFPWGEHFDPTWCSMRESRPGGGRLAPVDSFPVDESPYGIRGLAGNVYEWCSDDFSDEGPELVDGNWRPRAAASPFKVVRGGSWESSEGKCRCAYRASAKIETRSALVGFRLVCGPPPRGQLFLALQQA